MYEITPGPHLKQGQISEQTLLKTVLQDCASDVQALQAALVGGLHAAAVKSRAAPKARKTKKVKLDPSFISRDARIKIKLSKQVKVTQWCPLAMWGHFVS